MRIKVKFGDTGCSLKMTLKQWIRYKKIKGGKKNV